ncbi:hypothetical protein RUM43_014666 [Polyplax serrata]|uniref:Immunoglobulin-like beta-sandwich domain-containing protein n=1 Tax=Polyplax serrata TaxID=468196 RepID=A0AAN8PQW5_POLSC
MFTFTIFCICGIILCVINYGSSYASGPLLGRNRKKSVVIIYDFFFYPMVPTRASVGWVKADTKAIQAIHEHVITHNPRVSVSHNDLSMWNLHIRTVQEEDRGQYMCQINTDPMKSQVG